VNAIAVFCGASPGNNVTHQEIARDMGRAIAQKGITLVYGGGNVGLMGIIADAALDAGGQVIGVIPKFLAEREVAHTRLTQTHFVQSMHERKALMADLSDGFIALPGGYGTLDEFCEILTWAQLKLHNKPIGILNALGYFDSLLDFFDHVVDQGFLNEGLRALILEASTPEKVLELLISHQTHPVR
jgi:uncharacterized protein (TIGR00730 family)